MKILKNSFVFLSILFFILLTPTYSKKRNLSTPLSRLVGHWQDANGFEYYFGPVDHSTMTGSFARVIPSEKEILKYARKLMNYAAQKYLEKGRFKDKEEAEDWIEAQFKEQEEEMIATAEKSAGIANYGKYKVLTHVAKGEKVEIIIHWPANTIRPFPEGLTIFHIEKKGKQIILDVKAKSVEHRSPGGGSGYRTDPVEDVTNPLKYIDSKTSPEDK